MQSEPRSTRVVELVAVARRSPDRCALRHGGTSFDMLTKRQTPSETKALVTRYKEKALILDKVAKLSQQTRAFGMRVERDPAAILEGRMKVMLPKLLPRLRAAAVARRCLAQGPSHSRPVATEAAAAAAASGAATRCWTRTAGWPARARAAAN